LLSVKGSVLIQWNSEFGESVAQHQEKVNVNVNNVNSEVLEGAGTTHLSRLPELAISASQFDLRQEIRLLRKEASWQRGIGRSSRTLVKQQDFRIVLVLMKARTRLSEHRASARMSIQTVFGQIRVHLSTENIIELRTAGLLALDSSIPYDIESVKESAFLLTISWPKDYATWIDGERLGSITH
jgi:quercetin dioxygenase-like cupin family protein